VKEKTKPPGTSGSLAFPCERADHLEVSCSERYLRPRPPSNGSKKFTFHRMWTTVWTRCAPPRDALWTKDMIEACLGVSYVETTLITGLI
jgi:hypothetical protein